MHSILRAALKPSAALGVFVASSLKPTMAADEIGPLGPISAWFKPVADQTLVLSWDLKVLRVAGAEKVIGWP